LPLPLTQPSPPDPVAVNRHQKAARFPDIKDAKRPAHVVDGGGVIEIAAAKQDGAGARFLHCHQEPGIIMIGCDDDPGLRCCTRNDFSVWRAMQSNRAGMNRIVTVLHEPQGEARRQWHID
jgi:hypothetical protein